MIEKMIKDLHESSRNQDTLVRVLISVAIANVTLCIAVVVIAGLILAFSS